MNNSPCYSDTCSFVVRRYKEKAKEKALTMVVLWRKDIIWIKTKSLNSDNTGANPAGRGCHGGKDTGFLRTLKLHKEGENVARICTHFST